MAGNVPVVTRVMERLAETLERSVLPGLGDGYAAQQARATAALLRVFAPLLHLDNDVIAAENAGMRGVLEMARAVADNAPPAQRSEALMALSARLSTGLASGDAGDINAANAALKTALAELIDSFHLLDQIADSLERWSVGTEPLHGWAAARADYVIAN